MHLQKYALVQLLTEQYRDRGVSAGAIGTILEIYGDEAYEIEFSHEDGTTITWFAVSQTEVQLYREKDLTLIASQKESA